MARGLITHWKMPVFFAADTPMTMELLWSIVKELEDRGFRVRGVTFDLGNKRFQKEFGLHNGVYKVRNPFAPDRWFYFCPDAPHALKRFRDHCLDKTYLIPKDPYTQLYGQPGPINIHRLLQDGDYVKLGRYNFNEIVMADTAEFKIHHKLKPSHLEATQAARCSVRVAAQMMSASLAAAMAYLRPDWATQAAAVQTTNDVRFFIHIELLR